ncbi:MAG TPA: hypothetical protein VNA20_04555 [Frankiaceae bacterium]|nr:hypothetical protein [Frankiaceae bacterium]
MMPEKKKKKKTASDVQPARDPMTGATLGPTPQPATFRPPVADAATDSRELRPRQAKDEAVKAMTAMTTKRASNKQRPHGSAKVHTAPQPDRGNYKHANMGPDVTRQLLDARTKQVGSNTREAMEVAFAAGLAERKAAESSAEATADVEKGKRKGKRKAPEQVKLKPLDVSRNHVLANSWISILLKEALLTLSREGITSVPESGKEPERIEPLRAWIIALMGSDDAAAPALAELPKALARAKRRGSSKALEDILAKSPNIMRFGDSPANTDAKHGMDLPTHRGHITESAKRIRDATLALFPLVGEMVFDAVREPYEVETRRNQTHTGTPYKTKVRRYVQTSTELEDPGNEPYRRTDHYGGDDAVLDFYQPAPTSGRTGAERRSLPERTQTRSRAARSAKPDDDATQRPGGSTSSGSTTNAK